jgi:hypothetical protein
MILTDFQGSARVSRAMPVRLGLAVSRRNNLFMEFVRRGERESTKKVCDREDALANTRDARSAVAQGRQCATQTCLSVMSILLIENSRHNRVA